MCKRLFSFLLTILFVGSVFSNSVTILPSDFTATENADYSITKDSVTVSVVASTVTSEQMRIFKGKTITISSPYMIDTIVFTCTANNTSKYGPGCFNAQTGYSYSGNTGTWTGNAKSVTFTAETNQVRTTSIRIVYTPSTDTTIVIPIDTTEIVDTTDIPEPPVVESIMTPGTNAFVCTVNGKDGVKVGSSKNPGDMTITIPENTYILYFYAAGWKGVTATLSIEGATVSPNEIDLLADDGISNNSPFTLTGDEEDFKYTLALEGINTETTLTLSSSKRFVVWNASYEVKQGTTTDFLQVSYSIKSYKVFDNQQIIIIKDNKKYNVLGQRLR